MNDAAFKSGRWYCSINRRIGNTLDKTGVMHILEQKRFEKGKFYDKYRR